MEAKDTPRPHPGGARSMESWLVSAGRDRRPGAPLNVPPWPASNFVLGERRGRERDECQECAAEKRSGSRSHGHLVLPASIRRDARTPPEAQVKPATRLGCLPRACPCTVCTMKESRARARVDDMTPRLLEAMPSATTRELRLEIRRGDAALDLLGRPEFREAWHSLHQACPWATAFQDAPFADVWYRSYRTR